MEDQNETDPVAAGGRLLRRGDRLVAGYVAQEQHSGAGRRGSGGVGWNEVADLEDKQVYARLFPGHGEHGSVFTHRNGDGPIGKWRAVPWLSPFINRIQMLLSIAPVVQRVTKRFELQKPCAITPSKCSSDCPSSERSASCTKLHPIPISTRCFIDLVGAKPAISPCRFHGQ